MGNAATQVENGEKCDIVSLIVQLKCTFMGALSFPLSPATAADSNKEGCEQLSSEALQEGQGMRSS